MVAGNPPSNGDNRGPSLPPEPSITDGPTTPPEILTSTAVWDQTVLDMKNIIRGIAKDLTSTANLARHPPAMAKINPTPISESSNHIRANSTRAEPSTLPAGTPPTISPFENTENTPFQYSPDCHGLGATPSKSIFDPAPPSHNPPPPLSPSQYPDPTYRYTTTAGYPVYQCEYTGEYFFQNEFFDGKNYFGGFFNYFTPPPAYYVTPQFHRN